MNHRLSREFEKWKAERLPLMEEEFLNLTIDAEQKARLKAREEIEVVKAKLQLELEERKKEELIESKRVVGAIVDIL